MPAEHLPIYQIQDFDAEKQKERYFYLNNFAAHLQEHQFIQKPHKHSFFILLFITQGSGSHTIDFKEYPVRPGTVFFLTPGQVHSWQLSADTDGFILFFTPEYYLLGFPHKKLYSFPFFNTLLHQPLLQVPDSDQAFFLHIIQYMQQEHLGEQILKDDVMRDYLDIMLIYLRRLYEAVDNEAHIPATAMPQLQQLEKLIDRHYKEHPPVSFYADQLHMTTKQLNDTCKRATGKTTTELVQERVLLEARRLLVHSDLTVTQVAASLGYYDSAYFFRFFKKQLNETPEQFRAAHG
jgi:AraC-like DNA-binding protein